MLFAWLEDEGEGAYESSRGQYVNSYIKNIRCLKQRGEASYYDASFKYNYGENKYDAWSHPTLLNDEKYGNIWVWYTCNNSEAIDISNIQKKGSYVYVGKEGGCQLKFIIRNNNYYESEALAQTLIDYLNVPASTYNSQFNKLIVNLSNKTTDKIIDEIFNMSSCMAEKLSAEWRFFFFEKIINQDAILTEREAVCINRLFSTVKNESQASTLIASIKKKGYEYQLIKNIENFRSDVFNNIASGLSSLFYAQNSATLIEAGKKVEDVNFFVWQPYGNVQKMSDAFSDDPSFSTWYDMMYHSWTYSYTVTLKENGKFEVKSHGTAFSHLGPKSNIDFFEIDPIETVSVYFAQKNKFIGIEDYTVVMPGILLAWLIDQGEREANKLMLDIAITAASFYFPAAALRNAFSTGKYYAVAWNAFILSKELADRLLKSEQIRLAVGRYFGNDFVNSFIKLSNLIDCTVMFRGFFKDEIYDSTRELIDQWNNIANSDKISFQKEFPDVYSELENHLNNLNSGF